MRRALAVLLLSALAAGCTVTTDGRVVAAPTLGHAPPPLPPSELSGLLLDTGDIGTIMDAHMEVVDSGDTMYTNRPLEDGCLVWAEAQEYSYQGSGWTAVRVQQLKDHRDRADHIAYQAVVAFPGALGAHDFYASQVTGWANCDNRRVDLHDPGDPNAHYWSLSKASVADGVLTITRVQEEGSEGWACQRALTTANNVVVDVSACADHVDDRGAQIAKRIAKKIP
ncbi:sensor domain-containing protein [Mycobacterium paraseoulense]|uniref:Sensor domain-containing protein n=2 Tax=Mycobacterium paraseoulense TaxID=590652 RepID=A0A1X0IAT5_9MYCO|nr:sensor domain-containing protein [Mycobacterium paraseoulense]ORB40323.1 sensor domain-containing protein [Mycobacterium paraseoulense]